MVDSILAKKLQIKPGMKGAIIGAPAGYADRLGLGAKSDLSGAPGSSLDYAVDFGAKSEEIEKLVTGVKRSLKTDGLFWIAYPKGGSKTKTDLNRDVLRGEVLRLGLGGVSL